MAEVTNNDNVISEAIARFLTQFKNATSLKTLGTSFMNPLQGIEDTAQELYELRWITSAFGATLDKLGAIVDVSRNGLPDEEYRLAILSEITLQYSSGSIDDIISTAKTITGAGKVVYFEKYPATFSLQLTGVSASDLNGDSKAVETIRNATPAGVEFAGLVVDEDIDNTFSFFEDSTGLGFGVEGETSGGNFAVIIT